MSTLNDFLAQSGIKVAAAKPATPATAPVAAAPAAKTATPAKTAASNIPPNQPSKGEAAGGHDARMKKTEMEKQDTGAAGGDAAGKATPGTGAKTAAQKFLADRGIVVADVKTAEIMADHIVGQIQAQKTAELEKVASEYRAQGALMYQGMIQESTAWKLASGESQTTDEAVKVARALGIHPSVIIAHAQKLAEQIGGATSSPALVGGMLGSAARTDNSHVMEAGEQNGYTTETRSIEALAGTRGPVSGDSDEKLKRFTDVFTLPGNPGVNHGQAVDQGKKLGE